MYNNIRNLVISKEERNLDKVPQYKSNNNEEKKATFGMPKVLYVCRFPSLPIASIPVLYNGAELKSIVYI